MITADTAKNFVLACIVAGAFYSWMTAFVIYPIATIAITAGWMTWKGLQ